MKIHWYSQDTLKLKKKKKKLYKIIFIKHILLLNYLLKGTT